MIIAYNIEMPKSCSCCLFDRVGYQDKLYCELTGKRINTTTFQNNRRCDCPLRGEPRKKKTSDEMHELYKTLKDKGFKDNEWLFLKMYDLGYDDGYVDGQDIN